MFEKYAHKPSEHLRLFLNHCLAHNFKFHCLPLIALHIPVWLMPTPNTNLELTEFPKASTLLTVYQTHFSEIVNRTPEAILCFTDRSNQNGRIGLVFSIAGQTHMFRHRNTVSVFTAELQAILLCLENIITQNFLSAPPNLSHNFRFSSLRLGHLKTRLSSPLGQPHTHSTHLSKHHFIQSHFHVGSRSLRHTRQ